MDRLLIALWLLLLGVRWLATPYLMLGDPALADRVVGWDREPLLHCYQILLVMTLLVPVLRLMRRIKESPNTAREIRNRETHSL